MVDGKQVHKVKNSDRTTFRDVKVYAGDRFHPAADARYKNLAWETMKGFNNFLSRKPKVDKYHTFFQL